jgi:putative ABC transport system permease protein
VREIRIPGIRRVLRISWSERALTREVDDEIRFHLEARAEELMRLGASEGHARAAALAEFGDVEESRRELVRVDRRRVGTRQREELLMSFVEDLRYAARSLARRPALLAVITLTLGIGIAANAIMFGVVDQLLLRPPALVRAPEQVKRIYFNDVGESPSKPGNVTTYLTLSTLREQTTAFSDLAAYGFRSEWSVGTGTDARGAWVQQVSGNYFRMLGVTAALGRTFREEEDRIPVGDLVAVVSHGFWEQQLGADSSAIGGSLHLQGKTFTVVGVMPRGFSGLDRQRIDLWIPISAMANETLGVTWHNKPQNWWARIVGRLEPGVAEAAAAEQATAAYRGLLREWKHPWRDSTQSSVVLSSVIATRAPGGISRESKVSLWLMGVSLTVLLIACANVANLLIARTVERSREISVRLALGVSRGRLARMLLTEAGLLAVIGAVLALGIALVASRLVQNVLLPNVVWSESIIDARVFGFTMGVTMLCVLLAGLAPALQGVGTRVSEGLKASSRSVAGGRGRLRLSLMLVQTALSVVLLIGAGLFVTSLRKVVTRDVGVDHDRVLQVSMPLTRFGFDSAAIQRVYAEGAERIRRIPGVTNVAVAGMSVPLGGASASGFTVPGQKTPKFEWGGPYNSAVTSGFFATIGARIVEGRDFTAEEDRIGARVLIVTETLARGYWPGESAIGKCAQFGADKTCSEIVGVVATVLQFSLVNDDRATAFAPSRHPGVKGLPQAMLIRSGSEPAALVGVVRRELQALAPTMPFVKVQAYSEMLAPQLQPWRLGATMFTLFGAIALLIAAIGLYSTMAYWVSQRTHEIGVRMALGAQRGDVVRLVVTQGARAIVGGLVLGGAVALFASRYVTELLYETSPRDPRIFAAAALLLAIVALVALIVPVRRSTVVDPSHSLRAD